jgi:hypothetical protein
MTESALRAVLAVAAAFLIVTGALALVAPGTFFDEIGRYGVENSHYVGDVGAFNLAAGIAVAICIVRPPWRAPILWTGAIWFGLHALNHAFDIGEARSDARGWADTILLALGALGSAYLANVSTALRKEGTGAR